MKKANLFLPGLLSGLLTSLAWTEWCTGLILLLSFLPLLYLDHYLAEHKQELRSRSAFVFSLPGFLLWNFISIFWIHKATVAGGLFAVIYSAFLMSLTLWLIQIVRRNLGTKAGNLAFIFLWIAFEHFFMHAELSFPWLMLGNGLAKDVLLIQWYEFTGHFGGSLWILVLNILLYRTLFPKQEQKEWLRRSLVYAVVFLVPLIYSIVRYSSWEEKGEAIEAAIVQPNIDPYREKFGNMSFTEQLQVFLRLADSITEPNTVYVVGPETTIDAQMQEDHIEYYPYIRMIRTFLINHPHTTLVLGATTHTLYPPDTREAPTLTARKMQQSGRWYDVYNTAMQIDTSQNIQFYHKSKLVVGVEKMPFPKLLRFTGKILVNLGGTTGSYGTQEERTPLAHKTGQYKAGTAICYESIFGEFFSGYIREGANLGLIITNDGWWGNTSGYKQHLHYASLRAIETRRAIGRAANTGISCFVNQRGDLLQRTSWWEPTAIRGTIHVQDELTFYTRYGDYVARISDFLAAVLFAWAVAARLMRKGKQASG